MAWDFVTWMLVAGGIFFVVAIVGGFITFVVASSRQDKDERD